jgi:hypothetical protein
LILLSTGCGDTSKSPEDPTILGFPPDTAYLGVDYSYNFGAAGGDALLNYSLSNNPSWLALEKTTNSARPGIVLRGQPGITGGRNGEADLGQNESIRITSNDGSLLGDREFKITVEHNALSTVGSTITEGNALTPDVDKGDESVCEIPDMSVSREIDVEHENLRAGDGDDFSSASRTYTTRPALLRVDLDQPSVEPVSVTFRVSENEPRADTNECEANKEPCEYERSNRNKAIFGEDLLLNGNSDHYGYSTTFPEPPSYIDFVDETDEGGTGVLTFEPGKTSCFIPVWVHEDNLAESTERFDLELEKVTKGLATLEGSGAGIKIEDDTTTVSFSEEGVVVTREVPEPTNTDDPAQRDEFRSVTAELDRTNDTGEIMRAGVEWLNDREEVAANVQACYPTKDPADCTDTPPLIIEFSQGDQETEFFVQAKAKDENGDPVETDPLAEDKSFQLGFSERFQFGREFAASASDETSEVTVNEWATDAVTGFDVDSLVAGAIGEVYVAGTDSSGELQLRSINRLGETAFDRARDVVDLAAEGSWPTPTGQMELGFNSRDTNTSSSPELTRYLGLGYTSGQGAAMQGQFALFSSAIISENVENQDENKLSRIPGEQPGDLQWQYGTDEDELGAFAVRGLAVSNEGNLSIAATGQDDDPIRLAQLDNNTDGDTPQPDLRWTQSETTNGSNNVVGFLSSGLAGFTAVGSTQGTLDAEGAVGIEDFFFLGVKTDGSISNRAQLGTDETDTLSVADGGSSRVWLGGDGGVRYELDDSNSIDPDSPTESDNAFLMVTSSRGNSVQAVRNFAGSEAPLVPISIDAMSASGNSAVIAGTAKDSQVLYLSRFIFKRNTDDTEAQISLDWRIEVDGASKVLEISVFDQRKIFVGYRTGTGDTGIRLYDLNGNQLSKPK